MIITEARYVSGEWFGKVDGNYGRLNGFGGYRDYDPNSGPERPQEAYKPNIETEDDARIRIQREEREKKEAAEKVERERLTAVAKATAEREAKEKADREAADTKARDEATAKREAREREEDPDSFESKKAAREELERLADAEKQRELRDARAKADAEEAAEKARKAETDAAKERERIAEEKRKKSEGVDIPAESPVAGKPPIPESQQGDIDSAARDLEARRKAQEDEAERVRERLEAEAIRLRNQVADFTQRVEAEQQEAEVERVALARKQTDAIADYERSAARNVELAERQIREAASEEEAQKVFDGVNAQAKADAEKFNAALKREADELFEKQTARAITLGKEAEQLNSRGANLGLRGEAAAKKVVTEGERLSGLVDAFNERVAEANQKAAEEFRIARGLGKVAEREAKGEAEQEDERVAAAEREAEAGRVAIAGSVAALNEREMARESAIETEAAQERIEKARATVKEEAAPPLPEIRADEKDTAVLNRQADAIEQRGDVLSRNWETQRKALDAEAAEIDRAANAGADVSGLIRAYEKRADEYETQSGQDLTTLQTYAGIHSEAVAKANDALWPELVKEGRFEEAAAIKPAASLTEAEQEEVRQSLINISQIQGREKVGFIAKEVGLSLIPVYGTLRTWDTSPNWAKAVGIAGDVALLLPVAGQITAASRAGTKFTTAAKSIAVSSAKGLFRAIGNPLATARATAAPLEHLLPKRIPLSALETRTDTIRLEITPGRGVGRSVVSGAERVSPAEAMRARDVITQKAIRGEPPTAPLGGGTAEITRSGVSHVSAGAFHSTPDIRNFLPGATIGQGGKGGDLFVAPSLMTRFTGATSTGESAVALAERAQQAVKAGVIADKPLPGAVFIRDPEVLAKLAPSGKVYKGTVEIESTLPTGVRIPEPSQILFTRGPSGERLSVAIIGKSFSPAELARLKVIGLGRSVSDLVSTPGKITTRAATDVRETSAALKELGKAGDAATGLLADAKRARAAGDAAEAGRIEKRAEALLDAADARYAKVQSASLQSRIAVTPGRAPGRTSGLTVQRIATYTGPQPIDEAIRVLGQPRTATRPRTGTATGGRTITRPRTGTAIGVRTAPIEAPRRAPAARPGPLPATRVRTAPSPDRARTPATTRAPLVVGRAVPTRTLTAPLPVRAPQKVAARLELPRAGRVRTPPVRPPPGNGRTPPVRPPPGNGRTPPGRTPPPGGIPPPRGRPPVSRDGIAIRAPVIPTGPRIPRVPQPPGTPPGTPRVPGAPDIPTGGKATTPARPKGFELTYEGPDGEFPIKVANRQGVTEVERSLDTGKQRYGRDLFSAIPNDPTTKPEKTLIITEFAKQKPRISKFPVGKYDVEVVAGRKKLIFTPRPLEPKRKVGLD